MLKYLAKPQSFKSFILSANALKIAAKMTQCASIGTSENGASLNVLYFNYFHLSPVCPPRRDGRFFKC